MNNLLRPTIIDDIIGQENIKQQLKISIKSAHLRNDTLGHTIFFGPPGLGKTTLARAIAEEMKTKIITTNGANLRSIKTLMPILFELSAGNILFIDEIHRMTKIVEEYMLPCMEDFKYNISTKESIHEIDLPRFTLIGATTNPGDIAKPLFDRFKIKHTLSFYNSKEIEIIIRRSCKLLNISLSDYEISYIASISRGIPRISNSILEWVRDYLLVNKKMKIEDAVNLYGIDKDGLMKQDREYLDVLLYKFNGGPASLISLVTQLGYDRNTIEYMIEPYLIQKNLIVKTDKGRKIL